MIDVATIAFIYNHPCPLKCNFCCHTQENVGPGRLSPENVRPMLLGFASEPSVVRFAFTGGDPFLYIDEILSIMTVAREKGVTQPFHIVTSAFWAKSDDITTKYIRSLADLGMDLLYVSYDPCCR